MAAGRFFRRAKWDRERLEEIESYVQIETDENIARGMPRGDAHAAALRKFGNVTLIREEIYRMNTITFLDMLARDLRYGLRMLRHNPVFTVVAILTLMIGIGANTAVFSVVNSVLLKPLPYPKAEELVGVWQTAPGAAGLANFSSGLRLSASMYFTYAGQNRTFQAFGAWIPGAASVTGLAVPEQVRTVLVSDGVLQALAVPPALGRWLGQADQTVGAPETVMLGYGYWQRRFGRRPIGNRARNQGRVARPRNRGRDAAGIPLRQCGCRIDPARPLRPEQADPGRLRLLRNCPAQAGSDHFAGQCRYGPDGADLDEFVVERPRYQSASL